jgi:hypothetical protein
MRTTEQIDQDIAEATTYWQKYGNWLDALRKEREEVLGDGKTAADLVVEAKAEVDSLK